jgi:CubicO group peptidase (beta-lactamase class C family)
MAFSNRVMSVAFVLAAGCGGLETDTTTGLTDALSQSLDAYVLEQMRVAQVPGLAVAVVRGGQTVFSRGYGWSNVAAGTPATADTLFNVASISKTLTASALMQLVEAGQLGLDQDINPLLSSGTGWEALNPAFPRAPITPRMLLSHTSGIVDTNDIWSYAVWGEDSPLPLDTFERGFLVPGGAYYRPAHWSRSHAPGTFYEYSNEGIALAGDLVQRVSGNNLQDYSEAHIFEPLGMAHSSWFLAGLDLSTVAVQYQVDAKGNFVAEGYEGYPDFPSGQLRTSANELARFLAAFAQGGELGSQRILQASTVKEMETLQPSSAEGLSWEFFTFGGTQTFGHSGADTGTSADMYFDPATGAGFVLLTNGSVYSNFFAQFEADDLSVPQLRAMMNLDVRFLQMAEQ